VCREVKKLRERYILLQEAHTPMAAVEAQAKSHRGTLKRDQESDL
jgi:hypothetical protein